MGCHSVIEPSPITKIQINFVSNIYSYYYQSLKKHSKMKASTLTRDYCMKHEPKSFEDQLAYLEFLYTNDYVEEVNKLLNFSFIENKAAWLYNLLIKRKHRLLTKEDVEMLECMSFEHPSLHCLHMFTIVYGYYDIKQYTGFDKYIELCEAALRNVNEPLFYYFMKLRFDEIAFQHYWKTDNKLLAQKYAYKYVNKVLPGRQLSKMYHHLALCNLYEGYSTSISHAERALNIAKEHSLTTSISSIENHTIPFISAFHGITANVKTTDPTETAHLALANHDYKTAYGILSEIKNPTPFQETYLGAASHDHELLLNAHRRFKYDLGDHFFAKVPLIYLKKYKKSAY
ncbi:AimR family lysis-lysogeny pheromone receptor [Halobacillus sp. Marseille-Q1614]|uniref:AimR family lysis-lysogeny pheromone receptor n=1 Tax=Halobacillus sp. Marseille-Q1614 TaxID=2709134 RepID=UPI001C2CEB04|nr:AimR family lysis-lysogeny pheromone receptor [Halobacillus sp. Marseille-Q1614]